MKTTAKRQKEFSRLPQHVGIIPDGNRRWAKKRGLAQQEGYEAGIEPGLRLLNLCRELGIKEASVYGFTKENVHRPSEQIEKFREACVKFVFSAIEVGAALLVVGDSDSPVFPDALRPFTKQRTQGDIRVNLLVNYGWQWDLLSALEHARTNNTLSYSGIPRALASGDVSRVDLVVRWGGRRRLSGFLPIQCAYADMYVIDTLWPDMTLEEFLDALRWYQEQDITLGG
ncbi:MAG TPA: polyprenyl diphosphate synthase [Candidatus Limnocylindrales bacterium]|nr:polyprenyl diphosphate synthase [Candidatus Limnocylindrales bacterium]